MQKILSSAPHLRGSESTSGIMCDVIIALIPTSVAAVYFFGLSALINILVCVGVSIAAEGLLQYFCKKKVTIGDCSAAVTGLLLALNLPPEVPIYVPITGSIFAIIVVKQIFGGLGHNFMNPALGGRAFLLISFPVAMTTWIAPGAVDAVATATPLAISSGVAEGSLPTLMQMFVGDMPGCIGEVCKVALIAGGIYLLIRRVISWRIPVTFIGAVAVIAFISGGVDAVLFNVLAGGVILGAFFMATDYVTSPTSPTAQLIFGAGCGVITMVIRLFGSYPEGVSFSIIFMNLLAPLLDRKFAPKIFGEVAEK